MCGRKTLTRDMQSIIEEMAIEEWQDSEIYQPRFNIAPTQYSPVIVDKVGRHAKLMKWGLIPNWSKDSSIGSKLINARSETLLEKPSFQHLVPTQRCVVIADGYFEWKRTSSRSIPYYIHHPEKKLLPMAGLWDIWKNPSGKNIFSYTVITTIPALNLAEIHHRMPVILEQAEFNAWLDPEKTPQTELFRPEHAPRMKARPVSLRVNSPRNDDDACMAAVRTPPTQGSLF